MRCTDARKGNSTHFSHGLALSSFSLFLIVVVIIYANVDHILLDTILLDILHCN